MPQWACATLSTWRTYAAQIGLLDSLRKHAIALGIAQKLIDVREIGGVFLGYRDNDLYRTKAADHHRRSWHLGGDAIGHRHGLGKDVGASVGQRFARFNKPARDA